MVYSRLEKDQEAEANYRRSLAILEKVLGREHPLVGHSLHNLSTALEYQEKIDEAATAAERSLAIREKALGPDSPDTARHRRTAREVTTEPGLARSACPT
jgi:tetratricopeptide (TPR) repeat protein